MFHKLVSVDLSHPKSFKSTLVYWAVGVCQKSVTCFVLSMNLVWCIHYCPSFWFSVFSSELLFCSYKHILALLHVWWEFLEPLLHIFNLELTLRLLSRVPLLQIINYATTVANIWSFRNDLLIHHKNMLFYEGFRDDLDMKYKGSDFAIKYLE